MPLSLHAGDCKIALLWFQVDHQQRVMARDALAAEVRRTRHNGRMRDHVASAERLAATTRYLIHKLRDADAVTWAVEVGDDDAITITPTDEIPDPDCPICALLRRPPTATGDMSAVSRS